MKLYMHDLTTSHSEFDHVLAGYLDVAIQEVDVARYLDESHKANKYDTLAHHSQSN